MSFPNRVTRSDLGPRFRNAAPVENPETDAGEVTVNSLCDQVAGMNVCAPRVSLVAAWNSVDADFDIYHQAEAWNADQAQVHPELTRVATGRYQYLFAATYLDGAQQSFPTVLPAPRATCLATPANEAAPVPYKAYAWIDPTNPLLVRIAVLDNANTLVDKPFWLEVL